MGKGITIAIIWGVFCLLLAGWGGWFFYDRYNYVERSQITAEGQELGVRVQLLAAIQEREKEEGRLKQELESLETKKAELIATKAQLLAKLAEMNLAKIREDTTAEFRGYMEGWKDKTPSEHAEVGTAVKDSVADLSAHKDDGQKRNDDQVRKLKEDINRIMTEIEQYKKSLDDSAARLEKEKVVERNRLSDAERRTGELVSREKPLGLPACGSVMTSDPEHDLAVISLGSRHGVKPGMRFEVFQIRHGNERIHKGMLEVKTANAEVSSCTILVMTVALPRCPVCSYTAEQPEQMYCPRCVSPGTNQGAQKLNDTPKTVVQGKLVTDPIVAGDAIYNPLFTVDRERRYAVCGSPLVERDDYNEESVKKLVQFYGNTLDETLTARTDVLIALRGGEAVKTAKDLGIPIVYEWELFRYLER